MKNKDIFQTPCRRGHDPGLRTRSPRGRANCTACKDITRSSRTPEGAARQSAAARLKYKNMTPEDVIRERERKTQYRERLKVACFNMYSNGDACCAWCKNARLDVLTLDHIHNDGAKDRRENRKDGIAHYIHLLKAGYPPGLQVLCYNCNIIKHREFVRATREGRPARVGSEIVLD